MSQASVKKWKTSAKISLTNVKKCYRLVSKSDKQLGKSKKLVIKVTDLWEMSQTNVKMSLTRVKKWQTGVKRT